MSTHGETGARAVQLADQQILGKVLVVRWAEGHVGPPIRHLLTPAQEPTPRLRIGYKKDEG